MWWLRKFFRRNFSDKLFLLGCAVTLTAVNVGLRVFGYKSVSAVLRGLLAKRRIPLSPSRTIWGVRAAARVLRSTRCLAQAVTLHFLLARSGHESVIRIGVTRNSQMAFDAHAWVVYKGQTVIGEVGEAQRGYAPLTDLQLGAP